MYRLMVLPILLLLASGCGTPSFLVTPVQNTNKLDETALEPGSLAGGKILIVPMEGMIANAKGGGFLQPTENPVSLFTQQLERAKADKDVKAIVLRVNSPGGTVTASDTVYEQLLRFRKATCKPVVASFQEVAASGAYYSACAADRIYAEPTSVVGSIGVIFYTFNFSGTLAKFGASSEALKSGALKDMGSPLKPLTQDERQVMQGMIDEYFARFIRVVTSRRKITDAAAIKAISTGRVFSGRQAKELGLVDDLGLLEDAIAAARTLADAPKAKPIMYHRPYAYGGSIYAAAEAPQPQASNVTRLELPGSGYFLPTGFYYLWNP